MAIQIRLAESAEDLKAIYQLRYKVYIDELGRKSKNVNHDEKTIVDPLDEYSSNFLAVDDDLPVGALRITFRRDGELEDEHLYDLESFGQYFPNDISMTTKLIVAKSHRQSTVSGRLALACYEHALQNSIKYDFIDTNPHLVRLYQQLGYRFYHPNIFHEEYGTVVPLVLVLNDVEYLKKVRSPFRRIAARFPATAETRQYLENQFPQYKSLIPSFCSNEEQLWEDYSNFSANAEGSVEFFRNFSQDEITKILQSAEVLSYEPGDAIQRRGDYCHGIFGILEGQAEVVSHEDLEISLIDLLNTGDTFGELGFFEKSIARETILVREPSKVLVMSPAEFSRLEKKDPELAVRFMKNLFHCTSVRIQRLNEAYIHLDRRFQIAAL